MSYISFIRSNFGYLLFGVLLTFFSSFGQTFFISLFGGEIRAEFGLSNGDFGFYYGMATLASGFSLIWLGVLVDKFDLRLVTTFAIGGLCVASLTMALAPSVMMLGFAFYLLRFTGQGFTSHTAITAMARYFSKNRGKAIAVAGSGFPLGEAILPISAVVIMGYFGWRATWIGVSVVLVVSLPFVLLLLHRVMQRQKSTENSDSTDEDTNVRHWTRAEVLRDYRFYCILPLSLCAPFIITGLFFHQVHLAEVKGWTLTFMAQGLVIFSIAQIIMGPVTGTLIDRFSAKALYGMNVLPMALGLCVLASWDQEIAGWGYFFLAGLSAGAGQALAGSIWPELYGVRHLGAIRSLTTAIGVFGTAGSPPIYGLLIDNGVSMEQIAAYSALYTVCAAGMVMALYRMGKL